MDCGKGASYCNDCPKYNICYPNSDGNYYAYNPSPRTRIESWERHESSPYTDRHRQARENGWFFY